MDTGSIRRARLRRGRGDDGGPSGQPAEPTYDSYLAAALTRACELMYSCEEAAETRQAWEALAGFRDAPGCVNRLQELSRPNGQAIERSIERLGLRRCIGGQQASSAPCLTDLDCSAEADVCLGNEVGSQSAPILGTCGAPQPAEAICNDDEECESNWCGSSGTCE